VKRWFAYRKPCFECYDSDFFSILIVEREQIKRVRDSIAKFHSHVGYERDVERMNTALRLIDIVLDNGFSIINYKGNGEWELLKYVNTRNANRFSDDDFSKYESPSVMADLYEQKAWKIYNQWRTRYLRDWWD